MFKDNLILFVFCLGVIVAAIIASAISLILIPLIALWTIMLCFYYPYCKLIKKFFPKSKAYWRCWRRLYKYCQLRKRFIDSDDDNAKWNPYEGRIWN